MESKYFIDEKIMPVAIELRIRAIGMIERSEIYKHASGLYVVAQDDRNEIVQVIYLGELEIGEYVPEVYVPRAPLAEFNDIDIEELSHIYSLPEEELLEIRELEREFRRRCR